MVLESWYKYTREKPSIRVVDVIYKQFEIPDAKYFSNQVFEIVGGANKYVSNLFLAISKIH